MNDTCPTCGKPYGTCHVCAAEQPTTPEDVEEALRFLEHRVKQMRAQESRPLLYRSHIPWGKCDAERVATLRAHIERADACLKAAHERADKHANARFALQRRAEAAEQRVAVLEAVREAAGAVYGTCCDPAAMNALRAALAAAEES